MTARDWVIEWLTKDRASRRDLAPWTITPVGDSAFTVRRRGLPDAHVYCPDGIKKLLTIADLERSLGAFPEAEFIVIFRDGAANDVYPYAADKGVAVGRVGELASALEESPDIRRFVHRERKFVAQRLNTNYAVRHWERVGENAYRIARAGLAPAVLTVATFDNYEATADQILSMLEKYADLGLEAIVATNPSTRGFADAAEEVARNAAVELMTMSEFTTALRRSWKR